MKANNPEVLNLITKYKAYIAKTKLQDEVYKWKLIQQFKGRPDTNAPDFAAEYKAIKYGNLMYQLSAAVGNHIGREKPEAFRQLFIYLFDETKSLEERLIYFNEESLKLYRSIGGEKGHHQDERAISAYLTVHNPEKYTFYKSGFYQEFCKLIGVSPAGKNQKYIHYLELVDQFIEQYIVPDSELIQTVKSFIPEYYDGTNHLLLAQDILYCTLNKAEEEVNYWIYAPGENAYKWEEFYHKGIMALGWDELGDLRNYQTQEEVADKLREIESTDSSKMNDSKANFDFIHSLKKGDIIFVKKGNTKLLGYGEVSGNAEFDNNKPSYKNFRKVDWKIKGEWDTGHKLVQKTLTDITKYKTELNGFNHYYERLFACMENIQPSKSEPMAINQILYGPPGTGKTYTLKTEYFPQYTTTETALTKEQHFENVVRDCSWWQVIAVAVIELGKCKVGDLLKHKWIVQKAKLSSSKSVRPILWAQLQSHTIASCEFVNVQRKLPPYIFNKTEDSYWEIVEEELREQEPEVYDLIDSVENFKPDASKEIKRYEFTTFHQSFNYEDFIEGIKPVMADESGIGEVAYRIEDGIFKELCKRAESDPENRYAIFIDEINRGNVSNIFGELITLIEHDKRQGAEHAMSATLPYSKKAFSVPSNVDIYGTMNTADRSVEALDSALRRRFSFVEMLPKPDLIKTNGPLKASQGILNGIDLSVLLSTINKRIEKLLDKDHQIGHSYFLQVSNLDQLKQAFQSSIIPLLQEYFFGDYGKIGLVLGQGFFAVQESTDDENFFAEFNDYELDGILDKKVYHLIDVTLLDDASFTELVLAILPRS